MKLEGSDKILILLQGQKLAAEQLQEIKRQEMSWLKVTIVFYSVVLLWIANRWLSGPVPPVQHATDQPLLTAIPVVSLLGTALFACLFLRARHSCYAVKKRLHLFDQALGLYSPDLWDNKPFPPTEHASGSVVDLASWITKTNPLSGLAIRLAALMAANLGIVHSAHLAFVGYGLPYNVNYLVKWGAWNGALVIALYFCDYLHFMLLATSPTAMPESALPAAAVPEVTSNHFGNA